MSTLRGGHATTVLLVCCVLLAGLVTAQFTDKTTSPLYTADAPAGDVADDEIQLAYVNYEPPDRAAFNGILERPLFTQGRRPPEPPKPQKTAVRPVVRLHLRLLGVAMTQDTQVALVRDLGSNELLRLEQGMEHQGWTVATVAPGQAVLTRDEQVLELDLELKQNR